MENPLYSEPSKEKSSVEDPVTYSEISFSPPEGNEGTEMTPLDEVDDDGDEPNFYSKLDREPLTTERGGGVEMFSNPVAEETFPNRHFEYTVPQEPKPVISKSMKCAVCCSLLAIVVALLLLVALFGFCVFIWLEVSDLKSAPATSAPEQVTSTTLSAQVTTLNASTEAFFQQLLQNLSTIDGRIQQLSTSAEQELGLNSLSSTFIGQLNSSVTTLIQQMLRESSANEVRTQAQEQRLTALEKQLNSSISALSQQLLQDSSAAETRSQQQEMRLNALEGNFNSTVNTLSQQILQDSASDEARSQQLDMRLNTLEGRVNSSLDTLSQQLLQATNSGSQQQDMRLSAFENQLNSSQRLLQDSLQQLDSSQQFIQNSIQQQGVQVNSLEGQLNSSLGSLSQQLLQAASTSSQQQQQQISALGGQFNSSVDALSQWLLQDSLVDGNRAQDLNSSLNNVQSQVMQLFGGQNPSFPIPSCAHLPRSSPSGYYWVGTTTCSAQRVYCDMTRSCGGVTGGWTRLYYLDMTNSSQQCPSSLRQRTDGMFRTCGITTDGAGCSQTFLPSNAIQYSRICGRIKAYQVGSSDAFARGGSPGINDNYLDGVSLTYGSPRQHIWTFASALDEVNPTAAVICPCINPQQNGQPLVPSFVGNDYFCDTGSTNAFQLDRFYSEDPLWDGTGCGPRNSCCTFNSPPWFHKQLPRLTSDDIEMRVCRDQHIDDEDTAIEMIEIYVQ